MDHMHMGGSMDMASMTMSSSMDMASMTMSSSMDMASMTMGSMASMATDAMSGMDHSGMDHSGMGSMNHTGMSGMDHGSMGGMGHMMMNMYLTTNYKNYPVLFKNLKAANGGEAFGIFLLFFFASFFNKGVEFVKNYLESKVWNNPNYQPSKTTTIVEDCACDGDGDDGKVSDATEDTTPSGTHQKPSALTVLTRDFIRLVLCFLSELFGYAMMLVAMSYSLVYFFAVVLGMAVGRLFFERLSDKLQLRPGGNNFQGHH